MSFETIVEQCQRDFNKPVLDGFSVVRLIGCEETDEDWYYLYRCPKRGEYGSSAVGCHMLLDFLETQGCVTSTEGEKWNDLWRLDNWLTLNGAPKESALKVIRYKQ